MAVYLNALREVARVLPFFPAFVILWGVIVAVEIWVLTVARRRAALLPAPRPDPRLHRVALGGFALFVGALIATTVLARARLLHGLVAPTMADRATLLSDNLSALLNAPPFGVYAAIPIALLSALTVAIQAWSYSRARSEDRKLSRFILAALAVVLLGLAPLGLGVATYCALLIKVTAATAGVDPQLRAIMLTKGFEEAHPVLLGSSVLAAAGLAISTIFLGYSWARPRAAGTTALGSTANRRGLAVGAAGFAGAALFWAASLPYRTERRAPWPPPSHGYALNFAMFQASTIEGPDPVPWAPILFVESDGLLLDGTAVTAARATDSLKVLRQNYALLHPGEEFRGEVGVYCPADVSATALTQALEIAGAAGYQRPSFIWAQPAPVERPLLGPLPRWRASAAAMVLPAPGRSGWLDVGAAGTCGAFGERLLAFRRKGVHVEPKVAPVTVPDPLEWVSRFAAPH